MLIQNISPLLFLAGILSLAMPTGTAAELTDAQMMQGTWAPVKAELGGQPLPEEVLKTITLKLDNGKYAVLVAGEPDNGTYTMDSSSKPKGMVITGTQGPNKGKTFPAIFEVGPDTLQICYDLSGKRRPPEFKTLKGTKLYLVTYHRVNPK